jgi:hypothetical protein
MELERSGGLASAGRSPGEEAMPDRRSRAHVFLLIGLAILLWTVPTAARGEASALDWSAIANPILAYPDRMLKDPAAAYRDGFFYLFCSTRFAEPHEGPVPFYRSRDLVTFEELYDENLARGVGSPDIFHDGDRYVMVFQKSVPGSEDPDDRRLFYSTSDDLLAWSERKPLAHELHPTLRCIDATVAFDHGRFVLGYKAWQVFHVSESASLDGPWSEPVRAWPGGEVDWAENYQFVSIDGDWRMVATARPPEGWPKPSFVNDYVGQHEPFLYTIGGDGSELLHWARWTEKTHLVVPSEGWNGIMHANSAVLLDLREVDGYAYLFYAGANDGETFDGRGHGKIGVARSRDFIVWDAPGGE